MAGQLPPYVSDAVETTIRPHMRGNSKCLYLIVISPKYLITTHNSKTVPPNDPYIKRYSGQANLT